MQGYDLKKSHLHGNYHTRRCSANTYVYTDQICTKLYRGNTVGQQGKIENNLILSVENIYKTRKHTSLGLKSTTYNFGFLANFCGRFNKKFYGKKFYKKLSFEHIIKRNRNNSSAG